MLLEIKDLHAGIEGKEILKGLNLTVNAGEVHAIMGPNGSGKSTLSKVLAGHPSYEVISGEVLYEGKNLLELEPDERARDGVFLAFQYPVEVPGVSNRRYEPRIFQAFGQRRLFGRRKETQRDFADGGARPETGDSRRNRFGIRHRRAAYRRRRRQ